MAGPKIPYPPSPENVPEDLTDYPASYRTQQNLLLTGLFIFLLLYLGLIALCILIGVWCVVTVESFPPLKLFGIVASGVFFLFLVKGFFKRQPIDKTLYIEVQEEEQPVLFGFIHKLCDELGAPEPRKVWIAPDVNAAVTYRTSLVNLFVQPEKDLVIGLGLVNAVNMSEFKAVLAHEFGHFGQSSYASSYTYVASRIIIDLVEGEDWFDQAIRWMKAQQNAAAALGYVMGAFLWMGRKPLEWLLKAITLQRLAVSREQEFHADLVAASVAGSDAVVHCLLRAEFGHVCLMQSLNDLALAADHKLYTRDLYLHQDKAAPIVRKHKKDPKYGLPPELHSATAGKKITVFDREKEEEEEDEDEVPPMWRTHPANSEREENVKEQFIAAPVDHRSPWILFTDVEELKERVTYKFYRMAHKIKKNTQLAEPADVQQYIDNEHADTTYDPKYQGIYDDRPLEPGDLNELNQMIRESPWAPDRIDKVLDKLYEGVKGRAEEYDDLRKEKATLENTPGEPSPRMKKKIKKLDAELERIWEWYKSLDRRVYLVHVQMAGRANTEWMNELVERYRFHLEVQRMYEEARNHQAKAFAYADFLFSLNPDQVHPELVAEVMQVLRQAWRTLKNIVKDARDLNLPAMRNFEEGENLADFILEDKLVSEPPLSYVKGKWVEKLLRQLDSVRSRCFRLHWKSVGGILALQEKIAEEWKKQRAPIEAELVEIVPAEVVASPFDALPNIADQPVMAAEIVDAEVMDAVEVLDAEAVADVATELQAVVVEDFIEAEIVEEEPPAAEGAVAAAEPSPVPPPLPAAALRGDPVADLITFDAAAEPQPSPVQPAVPEGMSRAPAAEVIADIFSFDAAPSAPPAPREPVPPEEIFSLDLDSQPASAPVMAAFVSTPAISASQHPGPDEGMSRSKSFSQQDVPAGGRVRTIVRPGKNGRPAIKISFVPPGEKSPLGTGENR